MGISGAFCHSVLPKEYNEGHLKTHTKSKKHLKNDINNKYRGSRFFFFFAPSWLSYVLPWVYAPKLGTRCLSKMLWVSWTRAMVAGVGRRGSGSETF